MLTLLVLEGPDKGKRLSFGHCPAVVGRSGDAASRLSDPRASRQHAQFTFAHGRLYVQDLNSKNGTFVHGRRISQPTPLEEGDIVEIGNTRLQVVRAIARQEPRTAKHSHVPGKQSSPVVPVVLVVSVLLVGVLAVVLLTGGSGSPEAIARKVAEQWTQEQVHELGQMISGSAGEISPFLGNTLAGIVTDQVRKHVRWMYGEPYQVGTDMYEIRVTAEIPLEFKVPLVGTQRVCFQGSAILKIDINQRRVVDEYWDPSSVLLDTSCFIPLALDQPLVSSHPLDIVLLWTIEGTL